MLFGDNKDQYKDNHLITKGRCITYKKDHKIDCYVVPLPTVATNLPH